jgi:exosortase/archaeosortase
MKKYVAFIFQLMIWSGFKLAEWLSHRDHTVYKVLMFSAFFYLAFLLTRSIVKSNRQTLFITIASLATYGLIQLFLQQILPPPFAS